MRVPFLAKLWRAVGRRYACFNSNWSRHDGDTGNSDAFFIPGLLAGHGAVNTHHQVCRSFAQWTEQRRQHRYDSVERGEADVERESGSESVINSVSHG